MLRAKKGSFYPLQKRNVKRNSGFGSKVFLSIYKDQQLIIILHNYDYVTYTIMFQQPFTLYPSIIELVPKFKNNSKGEFINLQLVMCY